MLYEKSLIFVTKNNIVSINVNQSNNCGFFSPDSVDSVDFYAVISVYANTQKSQYLLICFLTCFYFTILDIILNKCFSN